MNKVDVSVIYYGKPYQTIVSILSLLKYSKKHINSIYITVEKKQPFDTAGEIYRVIQVVEPLVTLRLFYPKSFYDLGPLDYVRTLVDESYRFAIPYQYPLENAQAEYLFIMHNDMVFHDDMIAKMLLEFEKKRNLAGTGSIGQCWSCPASDSFAGHCGGYKFQEFRPTQQMALEIHNNHNTPRRELDIEILQTGRVHPLPECRLNEYACMIRLTTYRATTLPKGQNVCFGGNWGFTADLGTGWFYQMVNQGHEFQHFRLEDYAIHSSFNPIGQGIHAYSKSDNYNLSEKNAKVYLIDNFGIDGTLNFKYAILSALRIQKAKAKQFCLKMYHFIRRTLKL